LALLTACSQIQGRTSSTTKSPTEEKRTSSTTKLPVEEKSQSLPVLGNEQSSSVYSLLKFSQAFSALPADAQKREYTQIISKRKNEYTRMQLAMMAILPSSRYRDNANALAILDEHLKAKDSRDDGLRAFAGLMKNQVLDQQKQEDNLSQLTQKMKDDQKRADTLQHKLDELLEVEKAMNERREAQQK
jgi:hypothetical protein